MDAEISTMKKPSSDLQAGLQRGAAEALEGVAARGVTEISLAPAQTKRIYALAKKLKKPVGFLLPEWVIERIEAEEKKGLEHTA